MLILTAPIEDPRRREALVEWVVEHQWMGQRHEGYLIYDRVVDAIRRGGSIRMDLEDPRMIRWARLLWT